MPTCDCKKCQCDMVLKLLEDRDDEIFHQFLIVPTNLLYKRNNLGILLLVKEAMKMFMILLFKRIEARGNMTLRIKIS